MSKLLSTDEVAKILGVHRETVAKWIRQERIKAITLGRIWKVQESK